MMNNFLATIHFATVTQIDAVKHKVKAKIESLDDLETPWLLNINGNNGFYSLPKVGEMVAIVLDINGDEGVCLGSLYNNVEVAPFSDNNICGFRFHDGSLITHNNETGNIEVIANGKVSVTANSDVAVTTQGNLKAKASGSAEIEAPSITLKGDVNINGNLTISGLSKAKDHLSGSVSGAGHKHTGNAGVPTSPPY